MTSGDPRVLIAVIGERGHINPCIGVAQHLTTMGVDVAFASLGPIGDQIAAAGISRFIGPEVDRDQAATTPHQGAVFAAQVEDRAWLRDWIHQLLIKEANAGVALFSEAIESFDPHLIIVDPMLYPAIFAAAAHDRRWVSVSNSLNPVLDEAITSDLLDTVAGLAQDRADLFASHGLRQIQFRGCDALSPHLNIAFCTPELSGREVPGVAQVGPARTPWQRGDESGNDWTRIDERPVLYCSFGSQVYHQPERFSRIIEATAGRNVHVVLALHDLLDEPPFNDLPENVQAYRYAPQWQVLEHANAVITHGGANTVMEALATDTPVLIDPICNDQFHQAFFVERAGVGQQVDIERSSPEALWRLIEAAFQRDIGAVSSTYATDGSLRAAELILAEMPGEAGGDG